MEKIFLTISDIKSFLLLLLMFMITYTLLGMELFAYSIKFNEDDKWDLENGEFPDSTFNNFMEGFYSVFIVLANDGWSTIYFNHYRASLGFTATPYFISLLIFGQYILLNIFLAILLENFTAVEVNEQILKAKRKKELLNMRRSTIGNSEHVSMIQ